MAEFINRQNKYPGSCFVCGTRVKAGEGRIAKEGERWMTCCVRDFEANARQAPPVAASGQPVKVNVHVDLASDGTLTWGLSGKAPRDVFDRFLAAKKTTALRNRKNGAGEWISTCEVSQAGNIGEVFKQAGFDVVLSPGAATATTCVARAQRETEAAATTRLNAPSASGLYPFQRVGVQWLANRSNAVLADEQGCGKTVQTLIALPDNAPVLLVVPVSVKLNWKREVEKWRKEYSVTILAGKGSFRYPVPGECVVINYDILPKAPDWKGYGDLPALEAPLAGAPPGLVIIADEAHNLKNPDAQRTKNFRMLRTIANEGGGSCWLLTGTPLLNRPLELWGVFSSAGVSAEAFGKFDNFKRLFNATQGRFAIDWGDPEPEVPELMRRVMLRRQKVDVLPDMPSKTRRYVPIGMDDAKVGPRERKLFNAASEMLPDTKDMDARAVPGFPQFEDFSKAYMMLSQVKLKPTLAYLESFIEEEQPVLVFAHHVDVLKAVAAAMNEKEKQFGLIIGDTSQEERQQIVDDFQAGKLKGIAISIVAGGIGITLTRAANAVFLEPSLVPGLNSQAEDRCHRIGQTRAVTIHYMVLDHPLDQRIQDMLEKKESLIAATTGASTVLPTEAVPMSRGSALDTFLADTTISDAATGKAKEATGPKVRVVRYSAGGKEKEVVAKLEARAAKTNTELWAQQGLNELVMMDSDRARQQNEMGFSQSTTGAGHALNALAQSFGLTDVEWKAAIEICRTHRRQLVAEPRTERPLNGLRSGAFGSLRRVLTVFKPRRAGLVSGLFSHHRSNR